MGFSESKTAEYSIEAQKLKEFFAYYGYKQHPTQQWIDRMYSPYFQGSTVLNFGQSKTSYLRKENIPGVYVRAYNGKYRPCQIEFLRLDRKGRTIYYKWVNNILEVTNEGEVRTIEIPFESYAVFDHNYKFLKTVHKHCPPKEVVPQTESKQQKL